MKSKKMMKPKFEIDKTNKIISINPSPLGVSIKEMYDYLHNVWRIEDLRKERKEKLDKINEKQNEN